MALFRKKIPYDAILTAPNNAVSIPEPKHSDIQWAESFQGSPTKEALLDAVKDENLWRIEYALQSGLSVNTKFSPYDSIVSLAVQHQKAEAVTLLCAHGANLSYARYTALSVALCYEREILFILFDYGASIKSYNKAHKNSKDCFKGVHNAWVKDRAIKKEFEAHIPKFEMMGITVPEPTTADLDWAHKALKPIADDLFIEVCRTSSIWRMAYAVQSGTDVTANKNHALRVCYDTHENQGAIEFLLKNGADHNEAQAYRKQQALDQNETPKAILEKNYTWIVQDQSSILKSTTLYVDDTKRAHRQEFNFHAQRITSFIEVNDVPSRPSYQEFCDLKSEIELREAYNELAKVSDSLEPFETYTTSMRVIEKPKSTSPINVAPRKAIKPPTPAPTTSAESLLKRLRDGLHFD